MAIAEQVYAVAKIAKNDALPWHCQADNGSHSRDIARTNAARARVRSTLKQIRKHGKTSAKADYTQAVRAIEDYLPYLNALLNCVEADDLVLRSDPEIIWQAALSSQQLSKRKVKIKIASLQYELAATLLTFGICLANQAAVLVASVGAYETSASVSIAEGKTKDEVINMAAEYLCRASGVFEHLAIKTIPAWEATIGLDSIDSRPIELTSDVASALAKLTLADANLLAIRKLMSKATSIAHTTVTPGPPLDRSHPSPSLLAKLHINVFSLYDEARTLCKGSSKTASGEIDASLQKYLASGCDLAQAIAYKWLGVDAGEFGGQAKAGQALGWLEMAREILQKMDSKRKLASKLKLNTKAKKAAAGTDKLSAELNSIAAFQSAYKRVNDTVHFQTVPTPASLQTLVPVGRAALMVKPYVPGAVAFLPSKSPFAQTVVSPPAVKELDMTTLSFDDDGDSDGMQSDSAESGPIEATGYW